MGLVAAVAAVPILVMTAARGGNTSYVVGVSIFASSVVALYLASTLYHSLSDGPAKRFFRLVDHSAIFLLIAGSYTPFTLGVLRGPWGWTLLVLVWILATIGLTLKVVFGTRYSWASIVLYVVMGWLALIAIKPIWLNVPRPGVLLILAGGVAYTAGLGFFAAHRVRFNHFIWHLFVIAGTTCHFFAVLWYSNK
jgi:hemolysin III